MADGSNRAKARKTESKARVPDLRGRMPDLKERSASVRERVPELGERTARSAEETASRSSRSTSAGTHDAMPPGQNWPKRKPGRLFSRRHKIEVRFGQPIEPESEAVRREVMDEIREFWERDQTPEVDVLVMHRVLEDFEARHPGEASLRFRRVVVPETAVEPRSPVAAA